MERPNSMVQEFTNASPDKINYTKFGQFAEVIKESEDSAGDIFAFSKLMGKLSLSDRKKWFLVEFGVKNAIFEYINKSKKYAEGLSQSVEFKDIENRYDLQQKAIATENEAKERVKSIKYEEQYGPFAHSFLDYETNLLSGKDLVGKINELLLIKENLVYRKAIVEYVDSRYDLLEDIEFSNSPCYVEIPKQIDSDARALGVSPEQLLADKSKSNYFLDAFPTSSEVELISNFFYDLVVAGKHSIILGSHNRTGGNDDSISLVESSADIPKRSDLRPSFEAGILALKEKISPTGIEDISNYPEQFYHLQFQHRISARLSAERDEYADNSVLSDSLKSTSDISSKDLKIEKKSVDFLNQVGVSGEKIAVDIKFYDAALAGILQPNQFVTAIYPKKLSVGEDGNYITEQGELVKEKKCYLTSYKCIKIVIRNSEINDKWEDNEIDFIPLEINIILGPSDALNTHITNNKYNEDDIKNSNVGYGHYLKAILADPLWVVRALQKMEPDLLSVGDHSYLPQEINEGSMRISLDLEDMGILVNTINRK
jgi:hypothetical protein